MYRSTKTFGHDLGISAAFRQWRADSHCAQLHGYALSFRVEFEADELDERQWVVNFGALKPLRALIEQTFDHKTVIAADDPERPWFEQAQARGIVDLVVLPAVGCEKFAETVFGMAERWLKEQGLAPRCRVVSVEAREHGANSAIYAKG